MKKTLITILCNRNTSTEHYRQATDQLGKVLAVECDNLFPKATLFVDTPLARTHGVCFKHESVLVPILYQPLVETSHLDCAKAPGLSRSEMGPYYNIGSFSIAQPRELSRCPNSHFELY